MNESAMAIIAAGLCALFLLLFGLEMAFPLRRRKRRQFRRLYVNAVITVLAFGAGWLAVRPAAMGLATLNTRKPFGLVQIPGVPAPVRFVLAFLLMDYTFYWWHRVTHEWPLLWRFHNVHHFDPDLDVSTSFRFHFAEIIISTVFRAAQILVIGATPGMFLAYQAVFLAATMFHHGNLGMPVDLERSLNLMFVTPRMHGIHHSVVRGETNSNYGSVFRWWDALHGTLVLGVAQRAIRIGVPGYMLPPNNQVKALLRAPFTAQKDYWKWPNGRTPERREEETAAAGILAA
ncbi:MAG: sterol desaturase family protein [Planctomycetota bacterium]|jgi:sterol desaturase/sphingolipid hydroxylase (fatty acid hydroxylase superfamily)